MLILPPRYNPVVYCEMIKRSFIKVLNVNLIVGAKIIIVNGFYKAVDIVS